ncbi:hypothetical protein [Lacinutrix sp.]|uniref:hypothetical protein n=1 Tax=Lacinutrix sp. TaxID=1937692 RepID=UPI0025BBCFCC|nr:hypothetical protein [Lacinutrix sp.]
MKKQTILLLVFLFAITMKAQVKKSNFSAIDLSQFSKEEAQITTNTNLVLVGEYLYYKISVLNNGKLSAISKIGYVELVDARNKTILKHTLNLKNSVASNRIFIPTEIKTGHYKLLGYTNWTKNNTKKSYYTKDIYVINAFSNSIQKIHNIDKIVKIVKTETIKTDELNSNISVASAQQTYSNRALVKINVNTNKIFKNGNYSLSINKLDSIAIDNTSETKFASSKASNTLYIPEMRGQLIAGKISNLTDTLDIKNKNIALSITGKNYVFKIAETNTSGLFFFNLKDKIDSNIATFQVIEDNNEDFKISILENTNNNFEALSFNTLDIDSNLKYSIEQRNIKNQVQNAYYQNKKDSILYQDYAQEFYKTKEKVYLLDDYTRFKTVRETFIEIINEAGIRKDGDNYRIIVYDRYDEKKSQAIRNIDPLVVVDGMIVQNNNDLVNYNSEKIKSISIVVGQYLYGSKLYQGVINVSTFTKDFKTSLSGDFILETTLNLPEDETIYYQPEYINPLDNKHIPDYRRQLLWLPNVKLTETNNTFKTYTSDDKGTYKITLEGYSKNGEHTISTGYFTVK